MNKLFLAALILLFSAACGQNSQRTSLDKEAKTNKRLLPKYGLLPKTEGEISADNDFIAETMKHPEFNGNYRAASNHLIELGFNYLYRGDLRTAMYRFNQAFLLDSTNTDIYWGFGAFYLTQGNFEQGKKQYEEGLSKDPNNTHLLTDYATCFLQQYHVLKDAGHENEALANLDLAILNLDKSFSLNKIDPNTTTKLSMSYWEKGDCEKAWDFYDKSKALGSRQLTEAYTEDLKKKCERLK